MALMVLVRWRTSRSRARNATPPACCSLSFTGVNLMLDRCAASQITTCDNHFVVGRYRDGFAKRSITHRSAFGVGAERSEYSQASPSFGLVGVLTAWQG
jgi:hypothetical protein